MKLLEFISMPLVMLLQSVALALAQIQANKMRGFLTILGIMIGVACVAAVIALLTATRERVLGEFETLGAKIIFVQSIPVSVGRGPKFDRTFRYDEFEHVLEHCPSVASLTRATQAGPNQISYRSKSEEQDVDVWALDPGWHDIYQSYATTGRILTDMDNRQRHPVCMVSQLVCSKLGLNQDPTGQMIFCNGMHLTIVGVLERAATQIGDSAVVHVAFDYFVPRERPDYFINAMAKSPDLVDDGVAEMQFYLRQRRHIRPGQEDNFEVNGAEKLMEQFNKLARIVTLTAIGIVSISLLVGGVGIMNIMLVSVSERTREIGLRKAVGARPAAIMLQFLVEAVVLCVCGGAMGLVLAQIMTSGVGAMMPSALKMNHILIPAPAIVLAFVFCGAVGVIFGFFPAVKAARLDPIEALRHD
jgi:putative ABC transport system permease protein